MVPKESQFDFTFSYWIFVWFLIYYFGITKYNPKIWLMIALGFNSFQLIDMIIRKNYIRGFFFIVINILIKIIPIYLLWNTKNKVSDFVAGLVLSVIFFLWVLFRIGSIENIIKYFKNMRQLEINNKPSTPLITFFEKRLRYFK